MRKQFALHLEHLIVAEPFDIKAYMQEDSEALYYRELIRQHPEEKRFTHWLHLSEGVQFWSSSD